ncbi:hypothetical protein [Cohnella laeviribosi]|jgi:hypothetical protein|uniref:hypothetical protein n=1 Tax=Cohnella laeviribosi TaxID=380174 RepID=UPI00037A3334|nr:hypothetical protein [Cohnella laeviribosi]
MEMRPLVAGFSSQDQAEHAARKLLALRADRFRIERKGGVSESGVSDAFLEAAEEPGTLGAPGPFSLSVQVPAVAFARARTVIEQAGGRVISE